jgi:hypothetical protein
MCDAIKKIPLIGKSIVKIIPFCDKNYDKKIIDDSFLKTPNNLLREKLNLKEFCPMKSICLEPIIYTIIGAIFLAIIGFIIFIIIFIISLILFRIIFKFIKKTKENSNIE